MNSAWSYVIARLVVVLALALFCGWIFGGTEWWLVGVFGSYLAYQLVNLYRLNRWLARRGEFDPPNVGGVWGDTIAQIVRLDRRKRYHKQRFIRVFRELRRSAAAMPDGVVMLTPDREIQWFNRRARQLLDLKPKHDIGLRIDNLIRAPEFVRYLDTGDFASPVVVSVHPNGGAILALHLIPYGEGGQILFARDITRQTQIEAMRKDFVANASHELRTPLTVIMGYLETLADDSALEAGWRPPLAEMRRQAERMNAILRDLLELSRLEAAGATAGDEPVDVGGLLALLRKDAMAAGPRSREINLSLESQAQVRGTEAELESAFSNLIQNAVRYTPEDGRIDIRWWSDERGGHVSVSDTGIGIAPEHIPRITERFYRVDAGRSRATGGSGLGLSIVKHALQRHDAELEVVSEEGQGSTFTCHFPASRVIAEARRAVS
ncbi:MAG TPA: phosphate regulon sensor histidine kinase PhoR [Steroidobacteraceae bacterium]|nr:phosphate regulon sensor histidine kinase PhoR [Steroidobacteraceae bacterium]